VNCRKAAREAALGRARQKKHFAVRQRASESECDAADCKPTRKSGLPLFLVALKNALSAHF
jgi:hypothetical protein